MRQVFHINDKEVDVISYLKKQYNISKYIVNLIKKDMHNELLTEERIIELIKKYSGGKDTNVLTKSAIYKIIE